MQFSYYPGCSLHATGQEYDSATRAVLASLGIDLVELDGWVCCGASSAHAVSGDLALNLAAVNLALAQEAGGRDLLAPCAACFNRTRAADYALRHDPVRRRQIESAVDFQFTGQVQVRSVLDVVLAEAGPARIAARLARPLVGLRAVAYYGCLLVRPPAVAAPDDPEHPTGLQQVLGALGAEARPWSYGTDCCGGSISLPRSDVAARLVTRLAAHAREAGAQAIVTACPLCQMNLEMRQAEKPALPIFYFTELVGLAFGLPQAPSWWRKHLVDPRPLLGSLGLKE